MALAAMLVCLSGACSEEMVSEEEAASKTSSPILDGQVAPPYQFPYAAFVDFSVPNSQDTWHCSGFLVDKDTVMTAAHCAVCMVRADVTFLGQPGVIHRAIAADGDIHPNPEAYGEDLGWCESTDVLSTAFVTKMENRWGADVAILKVHPSVDTSVVHPIQVLLTPPYGFNPVQALYEKYVTMVGRGHSVEDPGPGDLSVMRFGSLTVDAYWNAYFGGWGMDTVDPFYLQGSKGVPSWAPNPEATNLGGDSGGPVLGPTGRVLAVNSGMATGQAVMAPTFTARNAAFLRQFLTQPGVDPSVDVDLDGDNVVDVLDNCPRDMNGDQLDLDEDGVGDACDNCAPPYDGIYGSLYEPFTPLSDDVARSLYNPDQANCNEEAELQRLLAMVPYIFENGSLKRINQIEYPSYLKGTSLWLQLRNQNIQGDACDPIPCARTAIGYGPLEEDDFSQQLCPAGWPNMVAPCSFAAPNSVRFQSVHPEPAGETGAAGLRYCVCNAPHGDEVQRRDFCGPGTPSNCAIDDLQYMDAFSKWQQMSLADQGPSEVLTPLAFAPNQGGEVAWDSMSDAARLTGQDYPPLPWALSDHTVVGGPRLDGILWSHVVTFEGQETSTMPSANDRPFGYLASHYNVGDQRILTGSGEGGGLPKLPCFPFCTQMPQLTPWDYCVNCGFDLEMSVLELAHNHIDVLAQTAGRTEVVTDLVSPGVRALLDSDNLRIAASEPEQRLVAHGVNRREIFVNPTDLVPAARTILFRGSMMAEGELPVDRVMAVSSTSCPSEDSDLAAIEGDRALAYSAIRDEVYLLVLPSKHRGHGARLGIQSPAGWRELELTGEKIRVPQGMVFHLAHDALYVLDQAPSGLSPVRLLRIDLSTGIATELGKVALGGSERVSISVDDEDDLIVAVSRKAPRFTKIVRLRVRDDEVERIGRVVRPGELLYGVARANRWGVHYMTEQSDRLQVHSLPASAFGPVPAGGILCP